ncbi:MAG: hypothetical protein ACI4KD_07325 [Oscillospiraceae bacterium]
MLKGVNKRVIEINNPDGEYFERAILFVKPEKSETPPEKLSQLAKSYVDNVDEKRPERKRIIIAVVSVLMISAVIATLALIIL